MLLKYLCGTRQHDATFALKVQEKRRAELHCFIVKYPIAGPARGHWAGQQPALVETDIFWKLLKSTSLEYFAQKLPSWLRRLKVPERSWEHSNQSDQAQVQDRHWTGVCLIAYLGKVYFTINTTWYLVFNSSHSMLLLHLVHEGHVLLLGLLTGHALLVVPCLPFGTAPERL